MKIKKNYPFKSLLGLFFVSVIMLSCKKSSTPAAATRHPPAVTATAPRNVFNSVHADDAFTGYNTAFLVNSDNGAYYRKSASDATTDGTWVASLDILAAEDAYERTGSIIDKTLVNNLLNTWLLNTQPPWTWDGWNDDIGWFSLALIRGYQMTGNTIFLNQAEYGLNLAFSRGWDTQYNNGGIWEQQPDMTPAGDAINKAALSNNSIGKVACLIYQSTLDSIYLTKATQIYSWVVSHIYSSSTGEVYAGIDRNNVVDIGSAVYNQGTFVDYANYLYQITGNINYYNDAQRSIAYVKNNMTSAGIISNDAGYLNTWGDEMARGTGHFVRDNRLWSAYLPWMQQNANAIWANRLTTYNITWNGWNEMTPADYTLTTSKFASAVAWLQFTPSAQPDNVAGVHSIVSAQNGIAISNGKSHTVGSGIVQSAATDYRDQKWNFTQNEDGTWNIISIQSWMALEVPGGKKDDGVQIDQSGSSRGTNQRWWVDVQSDGSYKIWNQATIGSLDNSSNATDGHKLVQTTWNGGSNQRWQLK